MSATVHYLSHADKAHKWPNQTLPHIVLAARDAARGGQASPALFSWLSRMALVTERRALPLTGEVIARLHNAARRGRYVAELGPYDQVQAVDKTLAHGGDCEDWAAVLLAVALVWGAPVRIVTSGDTRDNFMHVYVEMQDHAGVWRTLDPKGSQLGAAFDFRSERNPVRRWWTFAGNDEQLTIDEVSP